MTMYPPSQRSRLALSTADLVRRARRVAQLEEQGSQYQSIFEATQESLVITDLNGFIVQTNRIAHGLYGYDEGEMIGMPITNLLHPESIQRLAEAPPLDVTGSEPMAFSG